MISNPSLASLHSYLCSDGYVITNPAGSQYKYYVVGFRNLEMALLTDFQKQFEEVFSERPKISKQKDRCSKSSKFACGYLISKFGSFYSREWKIPLMMEDVKAFWLRAFFDCEGWVVNIPGKDRSIGLDNVNHQGMIGIKELLSEYGITLSLSHRKKRDIWRLNIYGRDDLMRFRQHIGFLHPKKKRKLDEALASYDSWKWEIPTKPKALKGYIRILLLEKMRPRKHGLRIFSRRENLMKLAGALRQLQGVEAIIAKRANGQGTVYYELSIRAGDIPAIKAFIRRRPPAPRSFSPSS